MKAGVRKVLFASALNTCVIVLASRWLVCVFHFFLLGKKPRISKVSQMSVVLCDATLPPRLNWAINCKQAHLINNKPRKSITSQITLSLFIGTRLNPFRMEPFEQEKDVSFKSGKRRSGSKTSLIFLSVLSFILLVISIVFITLYALEKTKKTSAPQIPKEQKYCGSKACFDAAKGRINTINPNLNEKL